jgi:hypothetical protein
MIKEVCSYKRTIKTPKVSLLYFILQHRNKLHVLAVAADENNE